LTTGSNINFSTGLTGAEISVAYQVVEFENIKSLQSGEFTYAGVETTITVNSVDLNKSVLYFSFSTDSTSNLIILSALRGSINNATQLLFSHNAGLNFFINWYLVEFK
jgi:hypothetical protein